MGHISAGPGAAMILLLNKAIYLSIWTEIKKGRVEGQTGKNLIYCWSPKPEDWEFFSEKIKRTSLLEFKSGN